MLDRFAEMLEVSPAVAAIVLGLIAAQIALQVYALVDLARRDAVRGGKKWVWALVIAFGNLVGAIVYLAVGRTVSPTDVPGGGSGASTAGAEAARRAVDALYGPRDER
ncbi:MAG TPA: PLD nuclease N-terminal domain-containing protein [Gemmatimonadaceae bacterium]|jgi:hypothetical protein|nr:PLD nuclease N-terminal domain-containing protein [Gemmatimonadaceae bacterium]